MKGLLRNTLYNAFAIYLMSQLLPGVKVYGGIPTLIIGGFVLTILLVLLKPVLNLLALPLNLVTLGMFSFVVNIVIFYLLTVLVIGITISSFTFPGYSYAGFVIPKIYVNTLFAFILVAFLQSTTVTFLDWLSNNK
ncbi:phage holin family protein [Patescibacteria group bacterium]|nr:phage holin family protein [Patescibacteria group bacterium]